jgi:hypothetical protein
MWQSLFKKDQANHYLFSVLQTVFRTKRSGDPRNVVEEIDFWHELIRDQRTYMSSICDALTEAYKWQREVRDPVPYLFPTTVFDDEIATWNGLILKALERSHGSMMDSTVRLQSTAMQSKADAIRNASPEFPELEAGIWKAAMAIWQRISIAFPNASSVTMSIIKKNLDGAGAIVRLLEGT